MRAAPRIDADRLWQRLMALGEIGATASGGVNRQALSAEEIAAWRQVIAWAGDAGLFAASDPAGNLFLVLEGCDPDAPPILSGSHLDSQPSGGRFDGAYGVLAALEALTAIAATGTRPDVNLVAVAWMNEEGSRFAPGMMGSEAFAGVRELDAIRQTTDAGDVSVADALDALHDAFRALPRWPLGFPVAAYVEAHIEQHWLLERAGVPIGVVTGIQGKKTYSVDIIGEKGHAGTLAMADRRDALAAFARMAAVLEHDVGRHDDAVKFTIGRVKVAPNAPSVVPDHVQFSIDLRHPENETLGTLGRQLDTICTRHAAPCAAAVTPLVDAPSNLFDDDLQALIERQARRYGYASMRLLSAAGHDARHLAGLCPSAMIFIPCRGGVSHAEEEWAEPEHVAAGAQVLAGTLTALAFETTQD